MRLLIVLLTLASGTAAAQGIPNPLPSDAERVITRFLDAGGDPDPDALLTGEALGVFTSDDSVFTLGPVLRGYHGRRRLRLLQATPRSDPDALVVAASLQGEAGTMDVYLFLVGEDRAGERDPVWRIEAVRGMALAAGFRFTALLAEAAAITDRAEREAWLFRRVSALLGPAQTATDSARVRLLLDVPLPPGTDLENLRLLTASDQALKAWARAHMEGLEGLAATVRVGGPEAPAVSASLDRLHLDAAEERPEYPGAVFLVIGGLMDNSVGFVHVPEGTDPPRITPRAYILVEPLGGGWHLFRTT